MMRIASMIFSELRHRPFNALLLTLVVAAASALVVYFETSAKGMDNETRLIQKAMGSNLTLIPADSDSAAYQLTGVVDTTMPEEVVDSLLQQGAVSMNHLIAVLERPIEIQEHPAMLTGIAKSRATPGRPKAPMNDGVEPGHIEIGFGWPSCSALPRVTALTCLASRTLSRWSTWRRAAMRTTASTQTWRMFRPCSAWPGKSTRSRRSTA